MLVLDIEYVYAYQQQLSAVHVMATCSQGHRGGGLRGFHQTPSKLMIFMMPYGQNLWQNTLELSIYRNIHTYFYAHSTHLIN